MADLVRLYDFTAGQPIRSSEVDAEFDQLVAGHNDHEDRLEILATYRTLLRTGIFFGAAPGTTSVLLNGQDVTWIAGVAVGPGLFAPPDAARILAADYAVTGKASKLCLRAQAFVNTVAPAANFSLRLQQITSMTGGANAIAFNLGAVVSGSSLTFTAPGAGSQGAQSSGDFALPTDGNYVVTLIDNGAGLAAGSRVVIEAQLLLRHV